MKRVTLAGLVLAIALAASLALAAASFGATNLPSWWIDHGAKVRAVGSAGLGPPAPGIEPFFVHLTMSDHNSGVAAPGIEFRMPTWHPPIYAAWQTADGNEVYLWVDRVAHSTDGIFPLEYRATDKAGNTAQASAPVKIDTRTPVTGGASGWVNGLQPYVLSAVDQVPGSGVAATIYRVDQATPWRSNVAATAAPTLETSVQLTPAGTAPVQGALHTIDFGSVDAALPFDYDATATYPDGSLVWPGPSFHYGNLEGVTWVWKPAQSGGWFVETFTGYQSRTVRLDVTPPVVTASGVDDAWHMAPMYVAFSATDVGSGVARIEWSTDGGANWTTGDQASVSGDGEVTVSYRATDMVGLVSAVQSVTVKVATTPPLVETRSPLSVKRGAKLVVPFNVTAVTPTALVTITIRNANGRTVMEKRYSGRPTNVWAETPGFRVDLKKGTYKVLVGAVDEAGNVQSQNGAAKLKVH